MAALVAWVLVSAVVLVAVCAHLVGRPSRHDRCLRRIGQLEMGLFPRIPVEERWTTWYAGDSRAEVRPPRFPRPLMSYWLDDEVDTEETLKYGPAPPPRPVGRMADPPPLNVHPPFDLFRPIPLPPPHSAAMRKALEEKQRQYEYIMRTYADRRTGRRPE